MKKFTDIFKMSDRTYDILVYIVALFYPGFITMFGIIASIWGCPNADKIVNTMNAVEAAMGTWLMIGKHQYKKDNLSK